MKEKQRNLIMAWLKVSIERISDVGLLPPISFHIRFSDKPFQKDKTTEASIQYYRHKKFAKLVVYPPFIKLFKEGNTQYLLEVVIHELAHLHVAELQELAFDSSATADEIEVATERLATVLAKFIQEIARKDIVPKRATFHDIQIGEE